MPLTIVVQMHNTLNNQDILRIKKHAKRLKKTHGSHGYMKYLDQAARELCGVRHFHEAQVLAAKTQTNVAIAASPILVASPMQHYLRSLQEYYLDF